jgi:Mg-chelatase subunit ChlD
LANSGFDALPFRHGVCLALATGLVHLRLTDPAAATSNEPSAHFVDRQETDTPTENPPAPEAPTPEAPTPEAPSPEAPSPEAPSPEAPSPKTPEPAPGDVSDEGEPEAPDATAIPALAEASKSERQSLDRLLNDQQSWPRRAMGAMRLQRYGCAESRRMLETLISDSAWQVRAFATLVLGRRHIPAGEGWFAQENEPRVVRTALRCRYPIETERVARGVRYLVRSSRLDDQILAAELGAASGDQELLGMALEATRLVILRMQRAEAGALSPRLAAITGGPDERRPSAWLKWFRHEGRDMSLQPAHLVADQENEAELSLIAQLDDQRFAELEQYTEELSRRHVDLALTIDCTSSMYGELAEVQGGLDDMMMFIAGATDSLRVGIVAYRDERDEFEVKYWDFTDDVEAARKQLWSLQASGGGDKPESVREALRCAYMQLGWDADRTKVMVLVGDAPPHVGYGSACVELAEAAFKQSGLVTHVVQAEREQVKHFPQIAAAGAGQCVSLEDDALLVPELVGLTLGGRFEDEFREFFQTYLQLCR